MVETNTEDIDVESLFDEEKIENPLDLKETTEKKDISINLSDNDTLAISEIKDSPDSSELKEVIENEDIPTVIGSNFPPSYINVVERIIVQYKLLPVLNYNDLYQEMSDLSIKSCPTPTLQVLNDEIQKVQSAKDRLAEIFISVVQCHNFKKRAVDILRESWGVFSEEKNADARKGDSTFRLSNFLIDFANIESLLKSCNHILKNLDSLHDSLSRRITIYQLTMKLQDIGRTNLPDYDFDRKGNSLFPEKNSSKDFSVDLQESGELSEEKF